MKPKVNSGMKLGMFMGMNMNSDIHSLPHRLSSVLTGIQLASAQVRRVELLACEIQAFQYSGIQAFMPHGTISALVLYLLSDRKKKVRAWRRSKEGIC